jgi:hypothetical protein
VRCYDRRPGPSMGAGISGVERFGDRFLLVPRVDVSSMPDSRNLCILSSVPLTPSIRDRPMTSDRSLRCVEAMNSACQSVHIATATGGSSPARRDWPSVAVDDGVGPFPTSRFWLLLSSSGESDYVARVSVVLED